MNSTRLGDDVETAPARLVDDEMCERALRYLNRRAGADADQFAQALGLAPYVGYERDRITGVKQVERQPRDFVGPLTYVAAGFNGRPS